MGMKNLKCKYCSHENREGAKFCEDCGKPLEDENTRKVQTYIHECVWYYDKFGVIKGPFTSREMSRLLKAGMVKKSTRIWKEGMEEWIPYQEIFTASGRMQLDEKPAEGWYACLNGRTIGPYSQEQMETLIANKTITGKDLIKPSQMEAFVPANKSALASLFPAESAKQEEKKQPENPDLWTWKWQDKSGQADLEAMKSMVANGTLPAAALVCAPNSSTFVRVDASALESSLPLQVMDSFAANKNSTKTSGWYAEHGSTSHGPMEKQELAEKVASGQIPVDSNVFYTGWSAWLPVLKSEFMIYLSGVQDGWYILEKDHVTGPFSSQDVAGWIASDLFGSDVRFWKPGYAAWMGLQETKGLLEMPQESKSSFLSFRSGIQNRERSRKKAAQWYIGVNGESMGPFPAQEVQQLYAQNRIDNDTYVWTKGLPDWIEYQDSSLYKTRMQESAWYYVDNGQRMGPFSYKQMQKLYFEGVIDGYSWVWKDGMDDWQAYKDSQLAY